MTHTNMLKRARWKSWTRQEYGSTLGDVPGKKARTQLQKLFFSEIWSAGIRSSEVAIELAKFELENENFDEASYFLKEAFGDEPDDVEARVLLAHSIAEHSPERALELLGEDVLSSIPNSLLALDILRKQDEYGQADALCDLALEVFPFEPRILVRRARIREAMHDWKGAVDVWDKVASGTSRAAQTALFNKVRLLQKFEQMEAAYDAAAHHLISNGPILERLSLSALFSLSDLMIEILKSTLILDQSGGISAADKTKIVQWLFDQGHIGLSLWYCHATATQMIHLTKMAEDVIGRELATKIISGSLDRAIEYTSPEIFLPHISKLASEIRSKGTPDAAYQTADGPRRILIVNATLSAGGAERQLLALVQSIIEVCEEPIDIHVAVFSLIKDRGHSHFLDALEELGVSVHNIRGKTMDTKSVSGDIGGVIDCLPVSLRQDIHALWDLASELNPEIIHGWQDRSAIVCGIVGLFAGIPRVVMSARNMQPEKRGDFPKFMRPLYQTLCNQDRCALTANSEAGSRDYENWIDLVPHSVTTINNGINTQIFRKVKSEKHSPFASSARREIVVGGVFRLATNKRPELWLETIWELAKRSKFEIRPRIVGSGPYQPEMERLAKKFDLAPLQIDQKLVTAQQIYGDMDVLLLMSRVEGTPNVVLEAQAAGIPVAACDVGGVKGALHLKGEGAGLLLPAEISATEAAERLDTWIEGALNADSAARKSFIERHFSIQTLGRKIEDVYFPEKLLLDAVG